MYDIQPKTVNRVQNSQKQILKKVKNGHKNIKVVKSGDNWFTTVKLRHCAENARHIAENVRHGGENVRHGTKNVRHGA